jgi:ubiquinone/menaquinone biosynthesis C-methylase UbiE
MQVKGFFRDLKSWDSERDYPSPRLRALSVQQRLDLERQVSPKGKVILDAGCGEGRLSTELLRNGAKSVFAADLSLDVMKRARDRANAFGYDLNFVRCDIERLPFVSGTFDVSACLDTFVHLPNPRLGAEELLRVTRKEGRVAINMTNRNPLWRVSICGLSGTARLFRDVFLYYFPEPFIVFLSKLTRRPYLGRHMSRKEFMGLFEGSELVAFEEYGSGPPVYFLAIAEKRP